MMSKCTDGCEWKVWHVGMEWGIQCTECFECMEDDELERRLNVTERLSKKVEQALREYDAIEYGIGCRCPSIGGHYDDCAGVESKGILAGIAHNLVEALRTYADILEK